MSILKTEFTIEKAQNGFILYNEHAGKNVFTEKKGISDFIAKSLVQALTKDYDSFSIEIKIENNPVNNK